MACKFCELLEFLASEDLRLRRASFWNGVDDWDRAHSNEYELWSEQSDEDRTLTDSASTIFATDPQAAFRIYVEVADAGSAWAMEMVGWHYDTGTVVPADFVKAADYYHRAICAGSWMATIRYAKLMAEHGHHEHADLVLEDGVRSGFVPANFWLAHLRLQRSKSRKTCREVRPLLDAAIAAGHPGAELLLARLLLSGKFGLRGFREGWRLLERDFAKHGPGADDGPGVGSPT